MRTQGDCDPDDGCVRDQPRGDALHPRAGKGLGTGEGSRRLKSPFQSALDLLSVCDMVLLHKASDALDLVTEAALAESFDSLHRSLPAWYAGLYISELLNDLTDHHDPHPRLFDASVITLRNLGDAELRAGRVLRFELACLRELGLMPALEVCVHCGKTVDSDRPSDQVAFGLSTGGRALPGHAGRGSRTWPRFRAVPCRVCGLWLAGTVLA